MSTDSHVYAARGTYPLSALIHGKGLKNPANFDLGNIDVWEIIDVPAFNLTGSFNLIGVNPADSEDPPVQVAYPTGHTTLPAAEVPLTLAMTFALAGRWTVDGAVDSVASADLYVGGDNSGAGCPWIAVAFNLLNVAREEWIDGVLRYHANLSLRCIVTVATEYDTTRHFLWRKHYPEALMVKDGSNHYLDISVSESAELALTGTVPSDYLSTGRLTGKKLLWNSLPTGAVADLEGGGEVSDEWSFTLASYHNSKPYVGKRGGSSAVVGTSSLSFELDVGAWQYRTKS